MQSNFIHTYYSVPYQPVFPGFIPRVAKTFLFLAKLALISGAVLLIIFYLPSLVYFVSSPVEKVSKLIATSFNLTKKQEEITVPLTTPKTQYLPKFDATLSKDNMVIIPSVGIKTKIEEATLDNYEEALKKGVWRVADFGDPTDGEIPTILAAHRYGYLKWSVAYRLKNSFYSLPKLEVGETVEVIWRQRKYIYIVYAQDKGEQITDYTADLILYTCESLSSPIRVFKYARLLQV
jgi:sortase (surface protein transpeptidase)